MAHEVQKSKAEERRRRHNQKGRPSQFHVGDEVLIRTHHLSSVVDTKIHTFFMLYEGLFVVKEIKNHNAYVVCDPNTLCIRGTYYIIFLR